MVAIQMPTGGRHGRSMATAGAERAWHCQSDDKCRYCVVNTDGAVAVILALGLGNLLGYTVVVPTFITKNIVDPCQKLRRGLLRRGVIPPLPAIFLMPHNIAGWHQRGIIVNHFPYRHRPRLY